MVRVVPKDSCNHFGDRPSGKEQNTNQHHLLFDDDLRNSFSTVPFTVSIPHNLLDVAACATEIADISVAGKCDGFAKRIFDVTTSQILDNQLHIRDDQGTTSCTRSGGLEPEGNCHHALINAKCGTHALCLAGGGAWMAGSSLVGSGASLCH
jgi:hypothetical protein